MKGLTNIFLGRPVMSLMLLTALCILGVVSLSRLPVGLLPNLQSPGITVVTRYSGVAASKIDELITIPLERQLSDIPGIEKIMSVSSEGESKINIIFDYDADIMVKILEASERVRMVRSRFPRDIEEPYIIQFDPTNRPVYIISFSSKKIDLKKLREIVDKKVKLKFERIEGVSEIFVGGGFEREVQVQVDPLRLAAGGQSHSPILQTIAANNRFIPGGKLGTGAERRIYAKAKLRSLEEIENLRIPVDDKGNTVPLRQVAEVKDFYKDRTSIARTNGEDRVTVYVQKSGAANTLHITESCAKIAESLKLKDIEHDISYNQGLYIRKAVSRVTSACVMGGIIAILVLYLFLRRGMMTMVIAFTTPCSILTTFFLMFLSDVEINVMSLSGLALGAGMLIDNSIVVSESIDFQLQALKKGFAKSDLRAAVARGTGLVFSEIVSATLTTIVVFIPLIFTNPETRRLYQGLTLTVVYSLLVSLIFSLTILPAFLYFFADTGEKAPKSKLIIPPFLEKLAASRPVTVMSRFNLDFMERLHARVSMMMFRRPGRVLAGLALVVVLIPGLFHSLKKEAFSPLQSNSLEATVDLDTGTHLKETEIILRKIEKAIGSHPDVTEVSARIEKWHATVNIKLQKKAFLDSEQVIKELRAKTDKFPNAFVYYQTASEGKSGNELSVEFYGDDVKVMKKFARKMSGEIQKHVPGIDQVVLRFREGKNDIVLNPDRILAAKAQTSLSSMGQTVRYFLTGMIVTKFYDKDREVDVRFKAKPGFIETPDDVYNMILPLPSGAVPLKSLVTFSEGEAETKVWRKNKRKTLSITVKFKERSVERVAQDIEKLFDKQTFPKETIYSFGDEYKKLQANQRQMIFAVLTALLVIYLLLGALFESFSQPFFILTTAPLSLAAVLALFAIFGMAINMSVYIGFIMLAGIVVNNSILVISTINQNLTGVVSGPGVVRAVIQATGRRIRPILMTTLTTVIGMAPMAFDFSEGSELFRPLAISVSVGMTFAVLISTLVVPFLTSLFHLRRLKLEEI